MKTAQSVHRLHVDSALEDRGTSLEDFVAAGQKQGKSMEEIWMDLRHATGVRFSQRTLYRWVNRFDEEAAS